MRGMGIRLFKGAGQLLHWNVAMLSEIIMFIGCSLPMACMERFAHQKPLPASHNICVFATRNAALVNKKLLRFQASPMDSILWIIIGRI